MSEKELTGEQELILDLFVQGCKMPSGKYNHCFLSAYEEAQRYLIERGIIKAEDCEIDA